MKRCIASLLACCIFLTGCATVPYRSNPSFPTYFDQPKKIVMLSPDVKMHQFTAGGMHELRDEWSETANQSVNKVMGDYLRSFKTIEVDSFKEDNLLQEAKDFLKSQKGLFKAVAASIIAHTYNPESSFSQRIKGFDYTLGPDIAKLSGIDQYDTLLFIAGQNYIWTGGRVAMALFAFAMQAATGIQVQIPAGPEWIIVALIDTHTGDIVWFNYVPMPGDLRNDEVNKRLSQALFKSFAQKWERVEEKKDE